MNPVTPEELRLWAGYVKSICGIVLDETKGYLIDSRLGTLARQTAVSSWRELHARAIADSSGRLRRQIISAITTNETSFFRDSAPFECLRHKIIPVLIDRRRGRTATSTATPLRLWSAACSHGQEVYSTLIVLRELLGGRADFDVRMLGTDISDTATAAASYGRYSRLEIERGMPGNQLERHFIRDGDGWRVRDEIRLLASFKTMNLLEPFSFPYRFDIIMCRNVAIYFAEEDRRRLFDALGRVLAPDGYLMIGATESITGLCPQFVPQRHLRTVYYQLRG